MGWRGLLSFTMFSHIVEGGEGCNEDGNCRAVEEIMGQGRQQFLEVGPESRKVGVLICQRTVLSILLF